MAFFNYYKATLEYLKDNKVVMLIVVSLFGGNIFQATAPTIKPEKPAIFMPATGCPDACINRIKKLERWHGG